MKSETKKQIGQAAGKESGPKVLEAVTVVVTGYYAGRKISERGQQDQSESYA